MQNVEVECYMNRYGEILCTECIVAIKDNVCIMYEIESCVLFWYWESTFRCERCDVSVWLINTHTYAHIQLIYCVWGHRSHLKHSEVCTVQTQYEQLTHWLKAKQNARRNLYYWTVTIMTQLEVIYFNAQNRYQKVPSKISWKSKINRMWETEYHDMPHVCSVVFLN